MRKGLYLLCKFDQRQVFGIVFRVVFRINQDFWNSNNFPETSSESKIIYKAKSWKTDVYVFKYIDKYLPSLS